MLNLLILTAGVAAIAWVNWYFFMAPKAASQRQDGREWRPASKHHRRRRLLAVSRAGTQGRSGSPDLRSQGKVALLGRGPHQRARRSPIPQAVREDGHRVDSE